MPLRWLLVAFLVFAPATALALTPVTLCNGQTVELTPKLTDPVRPDDVIFVRESLF